MSQNQASRIKEERSQAEWISFGCSLSILVTLFGLISYTWITEDHRPPLIEVITKNDMRTINGQIYLPFEVENKGGQTVESVQIIAELIEDGQAEQIGEQTIDFLSSGETEEGAFVLLHSPQEGEFNVRVGSYKLP